MRRPKFQLGIFHRATNGTVEFFFKIDLAYLFKLLPFFLSNVPFAFEADNFLIQRTPYVN